MSDGATVTTDILDAAEATPHAKPRRLEIIYFNTWADTLEPASSYLARLPALDLRPRVADPNKPELLRTARIDCDWYGENLRCFAAIKHRDLEVVSTLVCGAAGLTEILKPTRGAERWLVFIAQHPQTLGALAAKVMALARRAGVRIAYYAYDEASRFMPCFPEIAPHLDVLVHDELPLAPAAEAALRPDCVRVHRSWVANFLPFAATFNDAPESKILFLGSQIGLTPHRRRQIEFLQRRFKERFVASHDHSVSVADRLTLNRYLVGFCPEGRKFATPAMSQSHTDRPFWCGCLGMVPVSENSVAGNRLDDLARDQLIVRYPHGDLDALAEACEQALATGLEARRQIYDHFNRRETVGTVLADAIATALRQPAAARTASEVDPSVSSSS